ncbi:MAG: flavodoxin family protein [Promethearchaeati archaeon SRVP18_Atabeyarchaeia-1]
MRILVTYHSDTGNTEKVAKAIHEEASKKGKADLKKLKETKAEDLDQYDLVFLGSPCHAFDLSSPVKRMLAAIPKAPKYKLAGFITHMSPVAEKHEGHERCFSTFEKAIKEKQIDFKGIYDCQGVPALQIREFVKKGLNVPDAEWEKHLREMEKHPSVEDLQKAKEFARRVMSGI